MEKIFERILFMVNELKGNPAYPEYDEWATKWEKDHDSMESFSYLSETLSTMEEKYPIPLKPGEGDLLAYILSDARERINIMILASAWTSSKISFVQKPLGIDIFEKIVQVAEDASASKYSNS